MRCGCPSQHNAAPTLAPHSHCPPCFAGLGSPDSSVTSMLNYPSLSPSPQVPGVSCLHSGLTYQLLCFFTSLRLFCPVILFKLGWGLLKKPHHPMALPDTGTWTIIFPTVTSPHSPPIYLLLETPRDHNPQSTRKAVTWCVLEKSFPEAVEKGSRPSPLWVVNAKLFSPRSQCEL